MPELDPTKRRLTWTVYATLLMNLTTPIHTCLYVRACRLVTGTSSQPPRAIRSQPESIRIAGKKKFPLHFQFEPLPSMARPGKIEKKSVFEGNVYGLWLTASGARRLRGWTPLAARPVPWNGRGRSLVELTNGCYSGGDSNGLPGWIK